MGIGTKCREEGEEEEAEAEEGAGSLGWLLVLFVTAVSRG
jgi:hypothetical protein